MRSVTRKSGQAIRDWSVMKLSKREIPVVAVILAMLAGGLAASWMRWGNPLVDCGREMNQPLRLARGEMLYSQVRHIYGPLSPYLNAALFRVAGPSLSALYAEGILCTLLILLAVYWLSRQLMGRLAAAAATLSVMWLCGFKPAGNYILPYSYGALHGCLLGLLALVAMVLFIRRGRHWQALAAGIACGLAILAKTEIGGAVMIAGLAAAMLAGPQGSRRATETENLVGRKQSKPAACATSAAWFLTPAILITLAAYSWIAAQTGWAVLQTDSFLFLTHLPPELVYFNKRMSGLDHPLLSLAQIGEAGLRYGALAVIIASISLVITREKGVRAKSQTEIAGAGHLSLAQVYMLLAVSLMVFLGSTLAGPRQWDTGPYIAMPILLGYLLAATGSRYFRGRALTTRQQIVMVMSIYALASLARIILRVRSGGAYSSYLIPVSVILFTFCWVRIFPGFLPGWRARLMARRITLAVILADVVLTAVFISYRYRINDTYAISSDRGTILTQPDMGRAFDEAIQFISTQSRPGDPVAVLPEGTSLDFLTDRRNPLREEIITPGFLDPAGEQRAIAQLKEADTRLILVTNRPTPEFGPKLFGADYCQDLANWIEANYEQAGVFGASHDPNQQVGDKTFFIKAYVRKQGSTTFVPGKSSSVL